MTEKLEFKYDDTGALVIDFPYRNKLLTMDFMRNLIKKQLSSLNELGFDMYKEVIAEIEQERAKPRQLCIDDPWGNDVV